jgi:hypothetical protein
MFHTKTFYAFLAEGTLCVVLLPLFMTNTASYGAAGKVCYDRAFSLQSAISGDVGSPDYDPDWDFDDNNGNHLFPQHLFNSLSTVMSLFGFGVWLFFSPHQSDVAKDLDRTCTCTDCFFSFWLFLPNLPRSVLCVPVNLVGSYFAVQWLANLVITAFGLMTFCTPSQTMLSVVRILNISTMFGLSVLGTNLLCHRYLCEKARIMIKLYVSFLLSCPFTALTSLAHFFETPQP